MLSALSIEEPKALLKAREQRKSWVWAVLQPLSLLPREKELPGTSRSSPESWMCAQAALRASSCQSTARLPWDGRRKMLGGPGLVPPEGFREIGAKRRFLSWLPYAFQRFLMQRHKNKCKVQQEKGQRSGTVHISAKLSPMRWGQCLASCLTNHVPASQCPGLSSALVQHPKILTSLQYSSFKGSNNCLTPAGTSFECPPVNFCVLKASFSPVSYQTRTRSLFLYLTGT